ncbi:putative ATPase [Silvimonas terrae]|uniref:Putative ATPase n=1 Tax=Silvimonas terrae TaxID=300266 RepID=A0A840RJG0_9NEIS|nr:DUF3696 domain-containing protein [Silvimonas terrae]MBB5192620.1 putative ATPase [Silvimonas terrae]
MQLNGPFGLQLGTAESVRNWDSDDAIKLQLVEGEDISSWHFGASSEEALYLTIENKPDFVPSSFSGRPRAFTYLCAERLGPRSVLGASPCPDDTLEIGVHGEYCAQMVATMGNSPLQNVARQHPDAEMGGASLLKYEVEKWIGEIAKPIEIDAIRYPGTTVNSMRFRTSGEAWVHAPNMGFGISYALPIILAGLTAQDNGLLIVENPEAHLHPAGQSRMGAFLAWLAGCGIQVILETHSDHVLNGVRRAIGEHHYLTHDNAITHFFGPDADNLPTTYELSFLSDGSISHWPQGFFDQYQIDIASLGQIRRKRN